MTEILFSENQSTIREIQNHLILCNNSYVPALSSRVNLQVYAEKLFEYSLRYEAWAGKDLVGLIAIYKNIEKKQLFISNVSVVKSFSGQGIASSLLLKVIDFGGTEGFENIDLEVDSNNEKALKLYYKNFFTLEKKENNSLFLTYKL